MAQSSEGKGQTGSPSYEALIQSEWATIKQLEKMMVDPDLSVKDRTAVASVLAFHVNTLNKLLGQRGEKDQLDEQNLGDYISRVEPRIARRFRRDLRVWKRALSLKKY